MFTAAVLRPTSAALLKWIMRGTIDLESHGFFLKTPQGTPLPHHMTINMGQFDTKLNSKLFTGDVALLSINQLCHNFRIGACAAEVVLANVERVDVVETINKHPHITICLMPGAKPKQSNDIFEADDSVFTKLDTSYELEAIIEEIQ